MRNRFFRFITIVLRGMMFAKASPDTLVPTQPSRTNQQFGFTLLGETSRLYQIQATTNLAAPTTNWTSLATVTNLIGTVPFTDPATNLKQRFYHTQQ